MPIGYGHHTFIQWVGLVLFVFQRILEYIILESGGLHFFINEYLVNQSDTIHYFLGHVGQLVVDFIQPAHLPPLDMVDFQSRQDDLFYHRPNPPEIREDSIQFAIQIKHPVIGVFLESVDQHLVTQAWTCMFINSFNGKSDNLLLSSFSLKNSRIVIEFRKSSLLSISEKKVFFLEFKSDLENQWRSCRFARKWWWRSTGRIQK